MAEWVRFIPLDKGYYDPDTGQSLPSIEGRQNRPGFDRFEHKGTTNPLSQSPYILREHDDNGIYSIKLDLPPSAIDAFINSNSVFQARRMTQEEIDILEPPKSGVTP